MLNPAQALRGLAFTLPLVLLSIGLSIGLSDEPAWQQSELPAWAEEAGERPAPGSEPAGLPAFVLPEESTDASSGSAILATESMPDDAQAETVADRSETASGAEYDLGLVQAGAAAFQQRCVTCHDAGRATGRIKSLPAWRGVVQRMANKNGAEIASSEVEPIAVYLASLARGMTSGGARNAEAQASAGLPADIATTAAQQFTLFATLSPTWRGGDNNIQNPGFFPDTWVGANWQSEGPISARATACVTCHVESRQADRIGLVEAAVRFDLSKMLSSCNREVQSSIDAGRFIVPFGAFASQSSPGVYRTVSKPLMYNMGQRVFDSDLGDSVLPMPYSDEGANFNLSVPVYDNVNAALDAYVVNGLQGNASGIDYFASRDYVDNNASPSVGGRLTLGNQLLKFGTSVTSGQFGPPSGVGPLSQSLNYMVYGWDATFRCSDRFRLQFEYARRDSDRISFADLANVRRVREGISGYFVEAEYLLCRGEQQQLSFVCRLDQQNRLTDLPPPGSSLANGRFEVRRFTYGPNWTRLSVAWRHSRRRPALRSPDGFPWRAPGGRCAWERRRTRSKSLGTDRPDDGP